MFGSKFAITSMELSVTVYTVGEMTLLEPTHVSGFMARWLGDPALLEPGGVEDDEHRAIASPAPAGREAARARLRMRRRGAASVGKRRMDCMFIFNGPPACGTRVRCAPP